MRHELYVYTIVYILYNLWSAVCIVIPTDCIRLCKYTRDITKKIHRQSLFRSIKSHNLVYDFRQSTAINRWFKVDLKYSGQDEFIYMLMYIDRIF